VSRGRTCGPLLELDELRRLLGLNEQAHLGSRAIQVAAIVGTVGRCCDFDRCFHPLRPALRASTAAVQDAFADGAVPAIDLFKVGDAHFVSDGHKRVAAARAAGTEFVDAEVTEIRSPYALDATVERNELLLTERERWFLRESGLAEARPSIRVTAGSTVAYAELCARCRRTATNCSGRLERCYLRTRSRPTGLTASTAPPLRPLGRES
jgi:hypothetical protein